MRRSEWMAGIVAAVAMLVGAPARAEMPPVLYQGVLLASGTPANGRYAMRFEVFADATTPEPLSALVADVTVTDGSFSCDVTSLFAKSTAAAYLAVTVRAEHEAAAETLSRVPVGAVPFAARAETATHADSVDWNDVRNVPAILRGPTGGGGITLHDASDSVLGRVLAVDPPTGDDPNATMPGYLVLTAQGYLAMLDYAGAPRTGLRHSTLYYASADCSGAAFASPPSSAQAWYGRTVFGSPDGDIFVPAFQDLHGATAAQQATVASSRNDDGSCSALLRATSAALIPLKHVSRAEVGLPSTMTQPLRLAF